MKSCLSLLVMLAVIAAVLAGGYWLYQQQTKDQTTTLTLQNNTRYGLTVNMKGPLVVQFAIMPGKSQTRTIAPGKYDVEGTLSDPNTDAFKSSWTFDRGGKYNAPFSRSDGGGGSTGQILSAAQLQQQQQP
jgi:hypothetical protein